MTIPVASPKASYHAHKQEIDAAVATVLNSGWYILGEQVSGFEHAYARWCRCAHALGVANGTDAVEIALRACGIKNGDCVLTTANTANATVAAIERIGAKAVFGDIDPATFTLSTADLTRLLHIHKISAIVAVHLFGHPADMPTILSCAAARKIPVIEDCAQAHGATCMGQHVGSIGTVGAFSFYPTKNLGALGDGGAVTTNDPVICDRIKLIRQYGWRERYTSEIKGLNSRLDEIQAAILNVKLQSLRTDNERRQEIAARYNASFANLPLVTPSVAANCTHVYHQYTIRFSERDKLAGWLRQHGVGTAVLYPTPIHRQPAYIAEYADICLPETEKAAQEILALPVYPELTDAEVDFVIKRVVGYFKQ